MFLASEVLAQASSSCVMYWTQVRLTADAAEEQQRGGCFNSLVKEDHDDKLTNVDSKG
jgi:hypothetical protein